jgi:hypothetical protein
LPQIRPEFKAPKEWQYQVAAELSKLRDRVRNEKQYFLNQKKSEQKAVIIVSKLNSTIFDCNSNLIV